MSRNAITIAIATIIRMYHWFIIKSLIPKIAADSGGISVSPARSRNIGIIIVNMAIMITMSSTRSTIGQIIAPLILFCVLLSFAQCSDTRFIITSRLPEASPAPTMLTNSEGNTPGFVAIASEKLRPFCTSSYISRSTCFCLLFSDCA